MNGLQWRKLQTQRAFSAIPAFSAITLFSWKT